MDAERQSISDLSIHGFKTFKSLEQFDLRPLNIFIGANGSGKSNFLSLFKLIQQISLGYSYFEAYITKQGGPEAFLHRGRKFTEEFGFSLNIGNPEPFSGRVVFNNQSQAKYLPRFLAPYMVNYKEYHLNDTSENSSIKSIHPKNDNLVIKSDASNLAPFLAMLNEQHPKEYQAILSAIRMIAPFFGDFVFRDDRHIQLEWTEKSDPDTPRWADLLSDGTLRFIALATILLQPNKYLPDLVIIDEPELGLHPYALLLLSELIQQAAERTQVIIATHSTQLINAFEPEDIVIVDRVGDESTLKHLDRDALKSWLEDYSVGELWEKNVLGGTPL